MRKWLFILTLTVSCAAYAMQDTLSIANTTTYADTFKLSANQPGAVNFDEDAMMLELLHKQAVRLKAYNDSLLAVQDSINRQDSIWLAVQDSLARIARLQREIELRDSIAREEEELQRLKSQLVKIDELHHDSISSIDTGVKVKALLHDAEEKRQEKLRALKGYGPWFKELTGMLQFSQNYVSSNWYQGGNSNFAMYGSLKGIIKFDNKKWMTWETTGEWTEGFSTALGDSLRKMNMTDDLFKIYSKFNVKILPDKLYGSLSGEFQTPFFNTWKENTNTLKTGILTPVRFNWALGVDYKPIKDMSIVMAPLAYKLVYVGDTIHADRTKYGVSSGNLLSTFGSSVRLQWKWRPLREIALETVFYAYTNYRMIELDWEIDCDFIINRYMSARVVLHPRYDSSVIMDGDTRAKIQFKEFLSIGFAHKFH